MTLRKTARLRKAARKTVYTPARRKELPAFEVHGRQRFRSRDAGQWIERQQHMLSEPSKSEFTRIDIDSRDRPARNMNGGFGGRGGRL